MNIVTEKKSRRTPYNANAIRRCVRRAGALPDGLVQFASYSMTRAGHEVEHHPAVDLQSGACTCTCEHFQFRLARLNPTLWSGADHLCKHIRRSLDNLARRGELPQQNGRFAAPCIHCDGDGEYEVCDERTGEVLPGQFICGDCIEARMDDLRDAAPFDAPLTPVFSAPVEAKPDYSDPAVREAIFRASDEW